MDTHPYTVGVRRPTEADAPALEELAQLAGGRRIGGDDVLIAAVDGLPDLSDRRTVHLA